MHDFLFCLPVRLDIKPSAYTVRTTVYLKINHVLIASGPCSMFVVSLSLRTHAFPAIMTVVCACSLMVHCSVLFSHIFVLAAIFLYKPASSRVEKLTVLTVVPINSNRRFIDCRNFQKLKPQTSERTLSKLHIKCQVVKHHGSVFSSYRLEICVVINARNSSFWEEMPCGRHISTFLCVCFVFNRPYRGRLGYVP